jgi:hypothetical protein
LTERDDTGKRARRKPPRKPAEERYTNANKRLMAEARRMTANRRSAPRLDADSLEVLQEGLDGMLADLRFAQKMVDGLGEHELMRETALSGSIPNEWIRLRDQYRDGLNVLCLQIARTGIADRAVKVQEAQLTLLFQNIRAAFERAGVDADTIRVVGAELTKIAQEARGSGPAPGPAPEVER